MNERGTQPAKMDSSPAVIAVINVKFKSARYLRYLFLRSQLLRAFAT